MTTLENQVYIPEQQAQADLLLFLAILPESIRVPLEHLGRADELLEVIMDLGRCPAARFVDGEVILRRSEVTDVEITQVVNGIGEFDADNRAGIARTLHRIAGIRNRRGAVVGLTCRIGRAVYGTIDIIADIVAEGHSILLLGRPGVGKTTMLREIARILAEHKRVVIVDTSNEIGGDGDIPHPAVGRARRMQVSQPSLQHETMIEAVENHNPEVIVIDEIGREQEAAAARTINERGVQLIGTAHGRTLENLLLNPTLADLVGGIESVTLSDEEARRRGTQKTVLERRAPPTFDVLIEIQERQRLVVHRDVAASVDAALRGRPMGVEHRFRDEEGKIHVEVGESLTSTPSVTGRRRDLRDENEPVGRPGRERQIQFEGRSPTNGRQAAPDLAPIKAGNPLPARPPAGAGKRLSVYSFGVARNRLLQAARHLGVELVIEDRLEDAVLLVTLKSYYRKHRRLVADAERQKKPVYVLRANTLNQMESFLAEALGLEVTPPDPFEHAISDATEAIRRVRAGETQVDLEPVSAALRRYQHQMARQADLVSHSYGREPNRRVRIYATPRN